MRERAIPRVVTTIRLSPEMATAVSAEAERTGDMQNDVMVTAIAHYLGGDIKLSSDEAEFLGVYRWLSWNSDPTVIALWRDMRRSITTLYQTMSAVLEVPVSDSKESRDAGSPVPDGGMPKPADTGGAPPTEISPRKQSRKRNGLGGRM